jgi:hypothetical protein
MYVKIEIEEDGQTGARAARCYTDGRTSKLEAIFVALDGAARLLANFYAGEQGGSLDGFGDFAMRFVDDVVRKEFAKVVHGVETGKVHVTDPGNLGGVIEDGSEEEDSGGSR